MFLEIQPDSTNIKNDPRIRRLHTTLVKMPHGWKLHVAAHFKIVR